ncbi:hypothetical protein MLD38_021416 [Melastoma candidum]|uniref:Uncharacterized protein n=1 Tax=Melastoma candidum TaxID=119954 RepID=A0ACB9QF93_9MYRT|nr:hypothetical protein MLD38_021416 [Melastoma candidum]
MDFLLHLLIFAMCFYLLWLCYQLSRPFFLNKPGSNRPAATLPPGPPPLPVIGNLLSLGRLPHRSLHRLSLTYGPILKLSLGRITTVVVSSPSLARVILQTYDSCFSNRFVPDSLTSLHHHRLGLSFMPISPLFKTLRKIYSTQMFSSRKLDDNEHLRTEQVRQLVQDVASCARDGQAVNVGEVFFRTTLNLLSNTVFSVDVEGSECGSRIGELKELVANIMTEAGSPNIADYFPALKRWDPQGRKRRMEAYFVRMFDIFDEMMEKRMEEREKKGGRGKKDVLEMLLDICQDDDEDAVDLVLIKHMFLDVFAAGTDTTSSTLEWAMMELLCSPEKLHNVQSELRDTINRGNLVEESDLPRLPYLKAVIKETFRLHPPVPLLLPRIAGEEKLVGEYAIPKGVQVLVNVWGMGRDPRVWGENAGEFIPERFLESQVDVRGQDFELLPFGAGRRICPGMPLAIRMVHLMLGSLLRNFDWKFEEGINRENIDMDERFGITVQKAQPLKAVPSAVAA